MFFEFLSIPLDFSGLEELYAVFLVKTLAKNLVKNLARNLAKFVSVCTFRVNCIHNPPPSCNMFMRGFIGFAENLPGALITLEI